MNRSTLLILLFCFLFQRVVAQQDPVFTFIENHAATFNPAFSGLRQNHHGATGYRDQWNQLVGAPTSFLVHDNHRIAEHHGLGANYLYGSLGFTETQTVALNYNYQIALGDSGYSQHRISIGLAPGILHTQFKPEWTPPTTPDVIWPGAFQRTEFNLDFGLGYTWKGLFIGHSLRHLQGIGRSNPTLYNTGLHFTTYSGYTFKPDKKKNLDITPQIFLITDFITSSVNTQLLMGYSIKGKQRVWLGAGYRQANALQFMAGCDLFKRYRIAYSYEHIYSKLGSSFGGTHEFVIGYALEKANK